MFYLGAVLLLALAFALVVAALYRRTDRQQPPQESTVAALYQDRLNELRREINSGLAEAEDRQLLETELGAALLADYEQVGAASAQAVPEQRTPWLPISSAAAVLVLSLLVYGAVGDPNALQMVGAEQVMRLDPRSDAEALETWRERLSDRVDGRPEDAKSWYLLGQVDLKLGRYVSAAESFAMASRTHGEDPSIDLFWLQARYLAAGGQIDATTRSIAERVLATDPNQPLVLEIYAIDAFRQGEYLASVSMLNRALSSNLASGHRQALENGFQEARKRLGDLPASVDVAIAAQGEVPHGATLFVIARPVGGGMPFAVVRRPVDGLPRTVRLDDAVSMNPAAPLSSAETIEVVVRVSRAGTAMAHPGDWEWRSEPLRLADFAEPVVLEATLRPPA
ncbi:MAG TPA: c-type cytochrome biogenesis protein CcmI [Pseudomonadales bacterium]